jgi:hypothetical protein
VNANSTEVVPAHIMQGPSLIFDKSKQEARAVASALMGAASEL